MARGVAKHAAEGTGDVKALARGLLLPSGQHLLQVGLAPALSGPKALRNLWFPFCAGGGYESMMGTNQWGISGSISE